jgi:hypothetical protein
MQRASARDERPNAVNAVFKERKSSESDMARRNFSRFLGTFAAAVSAATVIDASAHSAAASSEVGGTPAADGRHGDVVLGFAAGTSDAKGVSARITGDVLGWVVPLFGLGVHASAGSDPVSSGSTRGAIVAEPTLAGRLRLGKPVWAIVTGGMGIAYVNHTADPATCSLSTCVGTTATQVSASVAGGLLIHVRGVAFLPVVRVETLAFDTTAVVVNLGFGGSF